MNSLTHQLERTIQIRASRDTVFRFFTESERWAKWWGADSTIEARPGGKVLIVFPGGVQAQGEVLEVVPPERIVFTYGFASGKPIPAGSSRVTIRLREEAAGTRLHLVHEFPEAAARDQHIQGWRFQLSVFANVVADEVFAYAATIVDAWFDAWAETHEDARAEAFATIAASDVRHHDRFSALQGLKDLAAHAGAAQQHMRGVRTRRKGAVCQCQGNVLAEWAAVGEDGAEKMTGTIVFTLGADRKITSAVSFANPPASGQ